MTGRDETGALCDHGHQVEAEPVRDNAFHLHIGRSWTGHEVEDDCPCGKAACGLVDSARISNDCPQHAIGAAKTMRQIHYANECPTPHEPDSLGIWDEDAEQIWLPVSHYAKRIDAIRFAMSEWGVTLPEVRCRVRWMVYSPYVAYNLDGSVAWSEDYWAECEKTKLGAFKVWRLEAA